MNIDHRPPVTGILHVPQGACTADTLVHEDMIRRCLSFIVEAVTNAGILSCVEFTDEELRRKGGQVEGHVEAIHVKAFGSALYKPKAVGELRTLVRVAMVYVAGMIERAQKA